MPDGLLPLLSRRPRRRSPSTPMLVAVMAMAMATLLTACGDSPTATTPGSASGTTSTSGAANGAASTTSRPPAGSAPTTGTDDTSSSSTESGLPTTRAGDNGMGEGEGNAIRKIDFANFTFPSDACGSTVSTPPAGGYELRDGEASHGSPMDADSAFFSVTLNADIAYGDLTGDGNDEAAVLLDCITGNRPIAHGWIYTLGADGPTALDDIVLDERDLAALGATYGFLLGAQISGGRLEVRWALFAPGDPACCPTKQATFDQRWNGTSFVTEGPPRTHE